MKTIEGDGWALEVPDVGYLIVREADGSRSVVELPGDEAVAQARDDDLDNGNQVYWVRAHAEDVLEQALHPVEHAVAKYRAGEIGHIELRGLIGDTAAERATSG